MSDGNKGSDIANYINTAILALLGIGGGVGGVVYKDEVGAWFMTRAYHDADLAERQAVMFEVFEQKLAPIAKSAEAGESNSLPPRIQNLLKLRCAAPEQFDPSLLDMLARLRTRYHELNGREYTIGECREGVYYNSLGVRVD